MLTFCFNDHVMICAAAVATHTPAKAAQQPVIASKIKVGSVHKVINECSLAKKTLKFVAYGGPFTYLQELFWS